MRRPSPRRPHRLTLRARLTLVYGGLFLTAGVVLLGVTYGLFNQNLGGTAGRSGLASTSERHATPTPGRGREEDKEAMTPDGPVHGGAADKAIAQERDHLRDAATASLVTQGGIALAVVAGAAAAFGWLIAGRVLAPLHRVTDTARRIASAPAADRGLHERIALRGRDDEVKELADAFDTMVERLDRSFDGQRRFVASASHELRTPLTLGRALVELAMHRGSASADVKRLGADLLRINARHERLIGGLLTLASSENEIAGRQPVDLADVAGHVVGVCTEEARRAGVELYDETSEAVALGDALLLERLVHNLIENGIRHNAGGWVRVTARTGGGRAELEVANTGPVVPGYEVPGLFEPFRRLGPDRVVSDRGAGLGLSIVRAVARAHGGEVTARPRAGGGLVVTVRLPGAAGPGAGRFSRPEAAAPPAPRPPSPPARSAAPSAAPPPAT